MGKSSVSMNAATLSKTKLVCNIKVWILLAAVVDLLNPMASLVVFLHPLRFSFKAPA